MLDYILPKEMAGSFSNHQALFLRYLTYILVDLTVLNFLNEFWSAVYIDAFSTSLLMAILLQVLLRITMHIEHKLANYFQQRKSTLFMVLRFLSTWFVLFASKLVILGLIHFFFTTEVVFSGMIHGLITFILVVVAILVAEQIVTRIYNSLA